VTTTDINAKIFNNNKILFVQIITPNISNFRITNRYTILVNTKKNNKTGILIKLTISSTQKKNGPEPNLNNIAKINNNV
jgi:hypothetical protein